MKEANKRNSFNPFRPIILFAVVLLQLIFISAPPAARAFNLKHFKGCESHGVLILPDVGINPDVYKPLIQRFRDKCYNVWFLEPSQDYSLQEYQLAIDFARLNIVVPRFAVVVHGFAGIPYMETANNLNLKFRTVFLNPYLFSGTLSPAFKKVLTSHALKNKPICWEKLSGKHLEGFKTRMDIPTLLFFNDLKMYELKKSLTDYLQCIPSEVVREIYTWEEKGFYQDELLFSEKKLKNQLVHIPSFIISGQLDNIVPYYQLYLKVRGMKNVDFIIAGRESLLDREYGHLTLVGAEDVFELIFQWLQHTSGAESQNHLPF